MINKKGEKKEMSKVMIEGDFHKCLHFTHKGQEFEVRITNEYDYCEDNPILEVWTVDYDEQGECQGFGELVAEKYLNGEKEKK